MNASQNKSRPVLDSGYQRHQTVKVWFGLDRIEGSIFKIFHSKIEMR
jgi:hypothetical protein